VVVVPENTAHPLVERRTKWVEQREGGRGMRDGGKRRKPSGRSGRVERHSEGSRSLPSSPIPLPPSLFSLPSSPSSTLTLYLLPTPRAIEARTEERRDHVLPTGYRDGGAWYGILSAAGPDRVSGERWGEAYAREYFRCIVDDGGMVWLYHDARADGWYLHGWWD